MNKSFDNTNDKILQRGAARIIKSAQFWLNLFVFSDDIISKLNETVDEIFLRKMKFSANLAHSIFFRPDRGIFKVDP